MLIFFPIFGVSFTGGSGACVDGSGVGGTGVGRSGIGSPFVKQNPL